LLYIDTDSYIIFFKNEDIIKEKMKDYDDNGSGELGKIKDEIGEGNKIIYFQAFAKKIYTYWYVD